jgi:hypothetical protein
MALFLSLVFDISHSLFLIRDEFMRVILERY